MAEALTSTHPMRGKVVLGLSIVEDAVYLGLGVLLSVCAVALLITGIRSFIEAIIARALDGQMVALLDQILLVLLVIELLYTVQVSFRDHGLVAEPFLVVALIAVIRRVLVLTAEMPKLPHADEGVFRHAIFELSLLALMIVVLVGSLVVMERFFKKPSQGGGESALQGNL